MSEELEIKPGVTLPAHELSWAASRSGGPGGQHVNTTSSKVTLRWKVAETQALSEVQRARVMTKLANRITQDGELVLHAESERSQHQNLQQARTQLASLVRQALIVPKKRVATKPSRAAKRKRVDEKKQRGQTKKLRQGPSPHD